MTNRYVSSCFLDVVKDVAVREESDSLFHHMGTEGVKVFASDFAPWI